MLTVAMLPLDRRIGAVCVPAEPETAPSFLRLTRFLRRTGIHFAGKRYADAIALAGVPLLINIPAAWLNFKGVQAQVPMTAAMMAACVAMSGSRWRTASFWLFVAIAMKPLAIVMALLCGALVREMRLPLVGAIVAVVFIPFAFLDWGYLLSQYQAMDW